MIGAIILCFLLLCIVAIGIYAFTSVGDAVDGIYSWVLEEKDPTNAAAAPVKTTTNVLIKKVTEPELKTLVANSPNKAKIEAIVAGKEITLVIFCRDMREVKLKHNLLNKSLNDLIDVCPKDHAIKVLSSVSTGLVDEKSTETVLTSADMNNDGIVGKRSIKINDILSATAPQALRDNKFWKLSVICENKEMTGAYDYKKHCYLPEVLSDNDITNSLILLKKKPALGYEIYLPKTDKLITTDAFRWNPLNDTLFASIPAKNYGGTKDMSIDIKLEQKSTITAVAANSGTK